MKQVKDERLFLECIENEIESTLDMWDFFSGGDEGDYGYVEIRGDQYALKNSAMETLARAYLFIKKSRKDAERYQDELRREKEDLLRKLKEAERHASMSDERIADELDREIQWFENNQGQEDLVYGPTKLMKYCRDRLRNTRTER